jgi:hypothetical protein
MNYSAGRTLQVMPGANFKNINWRAFDEQLRKRSEVSPSHKRTHPRSNRVGFSHGLQSPTPPPRTAITEDQIDPRLVGALPGQYLLHHVSESLTVDEDRSFRLWNRHHKDGPATGYRGPSWLPQVQYAALPDRTRQFSHPGSGSGPTYEQHHAYTSSFPQPEAPLYMQNLGSQQLPYPSQAATMHGNNDMTAVVGHPAAPHTFHQPINAATGMWSSSAAQMQQQNPSMHQSVQNYQQHPQAVQGTTHPNQYYIGSTNTAPAAGPTYTSSLANANLSGPPIIPTEDIDHLRGKEWIEAVEKRARDFQLLLPKDPKNMLAPHSIQQNADSSLQRSLLMRDEAPTAPDIDHAAASNVAPLQPHEKAGENGAQMGNGTGTPHFVNHPEFSNVTSSFPEYPY